MFRGASRVHKRVGHSGPGALGVGARLRSSNTSSQGLGPC